MRKEGAAYYAGTNEIHRYGNKAVEKASIALTANDKGYYSIPADGGKYWTIGTSEGKFGEFAKINGICFSVNKGGFLYAKAGTEKGEAFVKMVESMISKMNEMNQERIDALMGDDEEEEE